MTNDSFTCGGSTGIDRETPVRLDNPPGQDTIAYRVGTHARFRESLLARLSGAGLPALAPLQRRDEGDLSIALCDALATTLDVLSFHAERVANEVPLRTARESRSILELARLIGYRPSPGVAASTWLAFNLQEAPADPTLAAGPTPIPAGTRVQSVPGPGEEAQTFETVAAIDARSEWNAIPVQTSRPWRPQPGDVALWLEGLATGVSVGDVILIVGIERSDNPASPRWDLRLLSEVHEDRGRLRTRLAWRNGLSGIQPDGEPPSLGTGVHVFRQRAGLFGHNAPDRRLIRREEPTAPGLATLKAAAQVELTTAELPIDRLRVIAGKEWDDFQIRGEQVDLDAAYPRTLPGSWIALVSNGPGDHPSGLAGQVGLFRARSVAFPSRNDFGLSGRITRILPDTPATGLDPFRTLLRETLVLAQSEPLMAAAQPLDTPLYGDTLVLARRMEGIGAGRVIAMRGKAARVRLRPGVASAPFMTDAGERVLLREGDALQLLDTPELLVGHTPQALEPARFGELLAKPGRARLRLQLQDRDGRRGRLTVAAAAIERVPAEADDPVLQEIAVVAAPLVTDPPDRDCSHFRLAQGLRHVYDRDTVTVNANVAPASHGETVTEVVGSGDARRADVRMPLRQGPLTHLPSAESASGRRSTLALRVNDLLWQEVPSLCGRGPTERVYALDSDVASVSRLQFGDGIEGARLPSGDHNLRATYRKGLGLAGNVSAGRLTTLLSRPLGVSGVVNPDAAGGGEDPEPMERARRNAPLTVRTLDRAVSLRDYRDFARAFPGIAKAHALWIPHGEARGVFLSVAGAQGTAVPPGQPLHTNLLGALRRFGDPLVPLQLASIDPDAGRFSLRLQVKVTAASDPSLVLAAVAAALREAFSFEAREFGQVVARDEVAAIAEAITGVDATHVTALHRNGTAASREPRLVPRRPVARLGLPPAPAELLTLHPQGLVLETLP